MIGWDLFSGIGGVKCGMKLAGITPTLGIECDPTDRTLSQAFIRIHRQNGWHGTQLMTVQEYAMWDCPDMPIGADIAHISPVCADFSAAKNGIPNNGNMSMAIASMTAIEAGMPLNFSLEQVPLYRLSPEFAFICDRARAIGYTIDSTVLNIGAQCGQSRRRLFMTASLNDRWRSPKQPTERSWFKLIEDFIPAFAPITPTPRQQASAALWYEKNPSQLSSPLYVERVTSGKDPKSRGQHELIPTLMKSKFRDGSQNGRSKVSCLYLPRDRAWLNFNLEAYARLAGFPDTFRYPTDPNTVGSGFGYSVPPVFYAHALATLPKQ